MTVTPPLIYGLAFKASYEQAGLIMISRQLCLSISAIASTTEQLIQRGQLVDVAPGMVAMFGGMVALSQRELIAYLLETEADWPWAKQPSRK